MNKAIEYGMPKPHCDKCGYTAAPIKVEDIRQHIGDKCPDCGTVMVTQEDCEALEAMIKMADGLNGLFDAKGLKAEDDAPRVGVRLSTKDGGAVKGLDFDPSDDFIK